jgi:hypothetical protein
MDARRELNMTQIVLNHEQSQIVAKSLVPVQLCSPSGEVLGIIEPAVTDAEIAEARRRLASDQPRYRTAEVLEYLESLDKR